MAQKRIVFMGTPDYATVIFERLLEENFDIVALFTQPDKKVGRKQILTPSHIKQFCLDNGLSLPIYQPLKLRDDVAVENSIKDLNPDFIIVAAYGQILPKNILNIEPCINLHASLLPKYRGASPIQQCLLNDDKYTGVTSMMMEEGLDSGDILGMKYLEIGKDMTVDILFDKLATIAADLTIQTLNNYENIKPKKQNKSEVSHCGKIKKEYGLICFDDAKQIFLKYKAFKFWPGLFLDSQLKIKDCELEEQTSINNSGEILYIKKDHIVVGCTKGTLRIFTVQPASKKAMSVVDYIRGKRLEIGNSLS